MSTERRSLLKSLALGLSVLGVAAPAQAGEPDPLLEPGSSELDALTRRLAAAPRRRDFKRVPMILTAPEMFDAEAIAIVRAARCEPRQVWNNFKLAGPWLVVMENALNTQIWGWGHPSFLVVSATHGSAGLALYDEATWEKYRIGELIEARTGDAQFKTNTFLAQPTGDPADFENPNGLFAENASIPLLMRRGVVFMACHNAIWDHAAALRKRDQNPDGLSQEALTAELTNHLIPGAILTPGIVGTLPELQTAGFAYASI